MLAPVEPGDETTRLKTLRALNILDTAPEERFDRLTRLAKRLLGVPIALVSLVDEHRQWFKSNDGLEVAETSRDVSFCGHTILGDDLLMVPDTTADQRFQDNPLVTGDPHIRFYAGYPLTAPNGSKLGTLCLIDRDPRNLCDEDLAVLKDLACMAEQELAAVQLATMDELTSLSNRRGFEALSRQVLSLSMRHEKPVSLLYFDLDFFKQINDEFGHSEGDIALVEFSRLLKTTFRESDVLGRLGGDEFVALAGNTTAAQLDRPLERLKSAIESYNIEARRGYDLKYSVGVIEFDSARHIDILDLLKEADAQMYENKKQRRGRGIN